MTYYLGHYIWGDRFQEVVMKDVRQTCGKFYKPGLETKLTRTVNNLPRSSKSKLGNKFSYLQNIRDLADENNLNDSINLNIIFKKAYITIHEHKIWSNETPVDSKSKPLPKNSLLSGDIVNPDYLNVMSIGLERVKTYGKTYCCDSSPLFNSVERSEKDVNLELINTTSKSLHKKQKNEFDSANSFEISLLKVC